MVFAPFISYRRCPVYKPAMIALSVNIRTFFAMLVVERFSTLLRCFFDGRMGCSGYWILCYGMEWILSRACVQRLTVQGTFKERLEARSDQWDFTDWPAFFDDTEWARPGPKVLLLTSRLKDGIRSFSKAWGILWGRYRHRSIWLIWLELSWSGSIFWITDQSRQKW